MPCFACYYTCSYDLHKLTDQLFSEIMYITSKNVIHKIFKRFVICGTQAKKLRSGPLPFYNLVKRTLSQQDNLSMPKTVAKTSRSAQDTQQIFFKGRVWLVPWGCRNNGACLQKVEELELDQILLLRKYQQCHKVEIMMG